MLSTNKLRSIYSKIQTQLFYMIPEKWDKICLYASIIEKLNHLESGEMFFYYYPAGILKKNPINVYEIPNRFNIEEQEYMKLVDKLYSTIRELREAFKQSTEEKMWTNLTIIIENSKFNVEYAYEDLFGSKYTSYDRHIIWKCKYLEQQRTKTYTEGMYKKKVHNIVEYENTDKYIASNEEDTSVEAITNQPKEEQPVGESIARPKNEESSLENKKMDKYELYKQKQEEKKQKEKIEKENMKNQILKI